MLLHFKIRLFISSRISSLYNHTAPIKSVHLDQLKAYYRPVGEPTMTDANFDVEKHLSENVIRQETDTVPQTSGTPENQPNKPELEI